MYYYRLRDTSATGDGVYRQRVVEDLPVVLSNLAHWTQQNNTQPEAWLDYRIMKLMQNLLYSASQVNTLNTSAFQQQVRQMVSAYRALGFPFAENKKIRLAEWSVRAYFLFNRIYLKTIGFH
mgnify:CR=1 FL=1